MCEAILPLPLEMGIEELQGPGPGNIRGLFLISIAVVVHKGVVGPRVAVKLVRYAQAGQLCVVLGLVFRGWICVYATKVEKNGALHPTGPVKGALVCISPGHHDVAAEKWNRRLEMGVGSGA